MDKGIIALIKSELNNQYLWISMDETKDILKRNAVNIIAGTLEENKQSKYCLFPIKFAFNAMLQI